MNLDDLKTSWKSIDEKTTATQKISEQTVLLIIRENSKSTVSRIQNKLKKVAFYFAGLLTLFIAILAGNPFDYSNWYEYVPAVAYAFLVVAILEIVIRESIAVGKIRLAKSNLHESLQKVIQLHESYQSVMATVWKISMILGFLLCMSLLVRNFETYGWTKSILVIAGIAGTVIAFYLLAKMILKQLPDTNLEELKMNLNELSE